MALIVLWDIDHTLIDNGGVSKEIYASAFSSIAGHPPVAPAATDGRTDRLIMREMFLLHGLAVPEWPVVNGALETAGRQLTAALRRRGCVLPGVRETLESVQREGWLISSVLTGNIAENARTKLSAFDLDGLVDLGVGAYGADDVERQALVPVARLRVSQACGLPVSTPVVLVGDTPRDVEAALANDTEIIAVATGVHSADQLRDAGAHVVLADLTDTDSVIDHLHLMAAGRR
ncbi:HAD family hydrolase [Kitasatospora purpeofusca]|uniref:HAD family hydrolase n=1 Tax=Kitasatospora purpeofusca TaxID=67352 RepID=UPI002255ED44|nr:haloacid dehalogenase-like hydrolase [Kitasatospora purpeofusca]MCX4752493.1 haloacid dehalogenase-like hydrolase [Kitasatospora purpeofusca]WSR32064.1 haloacid dehalogenase-like hydrolase [Kitasatospora purpeofusca]